MMVGGIYCEIPLNPPFYKADAVKGIHWRLNKILGMNVDFFRKEIIDGYILDTIKKVVSEAFTQRRAKGYKDQTEELLRSHGYAIYYEGVCVNYGNPNFTGGSTFGTFVNAYEPLTTDGWMVLIGASAPYAARVESSTAYPSGEFKGYNKHVLIQMVEGLSTRIREKMGRKGAILKYGYILNSKLLGTVGKRHKIM